MLPFSKLTSRLPGNITGSRQWETEPEIRQLPDPEYVVLPLAGPCGILYKPVTSVGDTVRANQIIARSRTGLCLHTPVTGIVEDLKPIWTETGENAPAMMIRSQEGTAFSLQELLDQYKPGSADLLIQERLNAMGVICPWTTGTEEQVKERKSIDTVIVRAYDPEPGIRIQRLLLEQQTEKILQGFQILKQLSPAAKLILTLDQSFSFDAAEMPSRFETHQIGRKYSDRLENKMIARLTGVQVPTEDSPTDHGIAVLSIETLLSIADAVESGHLKTKKYISVISSQLQKPVTVQCTIGTAVSDILEALKIDINRTDRIIVGGLLQGVAQYSELTPVTSDTDGLVAIGADEIPDVGNEPCINCGQCVQTCPVHLQVNLIARFTEYRLFEKAQSLHPEACLACGLCSAVCPAHRPLVQLIQLSNKYRKNEDEYQPQIECSIKSPLAQWKQYIENPPAASDSTDTGGNSQSAAVRN